MKRMISFAAVAVMPLLAGCDSSKLSDLAGAIQDELGITVSLKTTDTDDCAAAQAAQFMQDYQALSDADQHGAKALLVSKYKSITMNPTTLTQTISGEGYTLQIANGDSMMSRELADGLTFDGVAPKTQVEAKDGQLTISTQSVLHKETNTIATAINAGVYQSVNNPADFKTAVRLGALTDVKVQDQPTFSCGQLARLKDIL